MNVGEGRRRARGMRNAQGSQKRTHLGDGRCRHQQEGQHGARSARLHALVCGGAGGGREVVCFRQTRKRGEGSVAKSSDTFSLSSRCSCRPSAVLPNPTPTMDTGASFSHPTVTNEPLKMMQVRVRRGQNAREGAAQGWRTAEDLACCRAHSSSACHPHPPRPCTRFRAVCGGGGACARGVNTPLTPLPFPFPSHRPSRPRFRPPSAPSATSTSWAGECGGGKQEEGSVGRAVGRSARASNSRRRTLTHPLLLSPHQPTQWRPLHLRPPPHWPRRRRAGHDHARGSDHVRQAWEKRLREKGEGFFPSKSLLFPFCFACQCVCTPHTHARPPERCKIHTHQKKAKKRVDSVCTHTHTHTSLHQSQNGESASWGAVRRAVSIAISAWQPCGREGKGGEGERAARQPQPRHAQNTHTYTHAPAARRSRSTACRCPGVGPHR